MMTHLKGGLGAEDFSSLILQIGNGDIHEDDGTVNISYNLYAVFRNLKSLVNLT